MSFAAVAQAPITSAVAAAAHTSRSYVQNCVGRGSGRYGSSHRSQLLVHFSGQRPVSTGTCSVTQITQIKHPYIFATIAPCYLSSKQARGTTVHGVEFRRSLSLSSTEELGDAEVLVHKYSHEPQTSVSLQTLMRTGKGEFLHKMAGTVNSTLDDADGKTATERVLIQVAGFLRRELPIRLAHRIRDLESSHTFRGMPSVKSVRDLYLASFVDLLNQPSAISSRREEEEFAALIEHIYERHAGVLVTMARGAFEFREAVRSGAVKIHSKHKAADEVASVVEYEDMEELHAFLDRFYVARIGIRVLIGQYLALRQPPVENYVGIICSRTSPYEIVLQAIDDASFMCARKYGDAPEVVISGSRDLTFPYVPTHLHYIMLELLKNSMRATVDWHGIDSDYPLIKVVIADGKENEDVVIKVSDEGGGIPRSNMKRVWSYLFTTADPEIQEGMVAFSENVDHSIDSPLAGLGYGLPISRSYARYFGGDLSIMSMEGYGTDAFVYLTRLGNTKEPLPI